MLALALLLEAGAAAYGPAASDNGASAAVAIALTRAIAAAAPPRNLNVELVLQGAGEGHEIGMRRYLKAHRRELTPHRHDRARDRGVGAGHAGWWRSDGRLVPIRYTRRLRELAESAADGLAAPHRGRGGTPALPARARGLPAIAIGASSQTTPDRTRRRPRSTASRRIRPDD